MSAGLPKLGDWKSPREAVAQGQARRSEVLERARHSPFYRDRIAPGDWEAIPVTTKEDLRLGYPFGFLAVGRDRLATYHESSGSSGEPTSSYFTEGDWEDIASRFARIAVGMRPGDAVMVKTPYSMVTTAHQMHRAARLRGAFVVPASNRSTNMPYSKVVRLLRELPINVVWCLPTEALLWAEAAELAGLDPAKDFPALRGICVAGEPLSPSKQRRIGETWGGTRVYQDYGSTETGSLAGECEAGRLHAWSDRVYFEVLDERTGRAATSGEGRLVVTPLFRQAMPLVRYAIGDLVRLGLEPCGCGWNLPTLEVRGRASSEARVQGRNVFQIELEELVYSLPRDHRVRFWRARHDEQRLELEIAPAPGQESAACAGLELRIRETLGVRAEVRAVRSSELVSETLLTRKALFQKPRFLFSRDETWEDGLNY